MPRPRRSSFCRQRFEREIRAVLGDKLKDAIVVTRDLGATRPGNTPGA